MSCHRLQAEADAAMDRYVSTCHMGGTPEQRTWAWARANQALDKHLAHEHAALARRSTRDTIEVPAVPFPGRST